MARVVKFAVRVLEVLVLFVRLQRESSVVDVARTLNYLDSSASLPGILHEHGYLRHGPSRGTYFPAARMVFPSEWVRPLLKPGKGKGA